MERHRQRCWWVAIPGRPRFGMLNLGPELDRAQAQKIAQALWPDCKVHMSDKPK